MISTSTAFRAVCSMIKLITLFVIREADSQLPNVTIGNLHLICAIFETKISPLHMFVILKIALK